MVLVLVALVILLINVIFFSFLNEGNFCSSDYFFFLL